MNIEQITKYMYHHLDQSLTMESVAKQFHYAPSYFSRKFKKITGVPFQKYLESMRIQNGMRQLLTEEAKINTIASQVGYTYSSNFSKIFKKHTGSQAKNYKTSATLSYKCLQHFINCKESISHHQFKNIKTSNQIVVSLTYPDHYQPDLVFVGLFPSPLPNQIPIVGLATTKTTHLILDSVPKGTYYLLACDVSANSTLLSTFVMLDNYRGRWEEPLTFIQETKYTINLKMEEPQPHHPLITVNLPKLLMDGLLKRSK